MTNAYLGYDLLIFDFLRGISGLENKLSKMKGLSTNVNNIELAFVILVLFFVNHNLFTSTISLLYFS